LVQANARSKWRVSSTYAYLDSANIDFDTVGTGFTNIGDWVNDGSGQITVPVDGVYDIIGSVETSTGFWTADRALTVHVNGSLVAYLGRGNGVDRSIKGTALLKLTKGDLLTFRINDSQSIIAAESQTYLSISRVADYTAGQPAGFGLSTDSLPGLVSRELSGTHDMSTDSEFTSGTMRYAKVGNICTMSIDIGVVLSGVAVSHSSNTAPLPVSMRPSTSIRSGPVAVGDTVTVTGISILTDGNFNLTHYNDTNLSDGGSRGGTLGWGLTISWTV
jgi:hypothetical protein